MAGVSRDTRLSDAYDKVHLRYMVPEAVVIFLRLAYLYCRMNRSA